MAYMEYHYSAFLLKSSKRVSILTGAMGAAEMLEGNESAFIENFRLPRKTLGALLFGLINRGVFVELESLSTGAVVPVPILLRQSVSSTNMQQRFQHSGETMSRQLRLVMHALRRLVPLYICQPPEDAPTPSVITANSKFYPFFEKCRMALDGTHIPVWVSATEAAPFHGRKGVTMNILAACDFDLVFTFVLASWEGTAGDGKQELFNLRHAQLRNCIERIFGILKMRLPILSKGIRYDFAFKVDVVLALCVIHNTQRCPASKHLVAHLGEGQMTKSPKVRGQAFH
ncbi:hypothetical protein H257_07625 [Aphanomyces astaci]|uniref:Uncharacterized protein n=1 Tax=Aphanomyces astaci TaxID=112090 RepID=W4GGI3_APHAT|nr:hypothetical protein H257_07625 [Aphanomyces astaci]ETV78795.1 hypothetical protein H257_07625 [Aphanomyces astaci]|eukprot:XP_009831514.1 hypothetical protein H257_07625 [Aphanomyces astaci]